LADFKVPSDQQRLENYFWELERLIPNPGKDWAKAAKPCKWAKILKEKANRKGGEPGK
jgi:hypothetical protein